MDREQTMSSKMIVLDAAERYANHLNALARDAAEDKDHGTAARLRDKAIQIKHAVGEECK